MCDAGATMAGVQEPLVYTPTAHVGQLGATTGGQKTTLHAINQLGVATSV